jgi:pantoate kinase
VETRDVNKAVKNNPDKFPKGYIFTLENEEFRNLRCKLSTANLAKTRVLPKAFTEQGLYMLATILKSPKATQATLNIIRAFTKLHELSRTLVNISQTADEDNQKSLLEKSGNLLNDLLFSDLQKVSTESSVEINLGLMKLKHKIKREQQNKEELYEIKELLQTIMQKLQ